MPERKNKLRKRVNSEAVQGEGSYVVVRSPIMDDMRGMDMPADGDRTAAMEYGLAILGNLVLDWNWVDDDGNPLPKPTPEVVRGLPIQELMFLMGVAGLDKIADQKN